MPKLNGILQFRALYPNKFVPTISACLMRVRNCPQALEYLKKDGVSVILYILAAIILLPLIEISVFIWVGGAIGVLAFFEQSL